MINRNKEITKLEVGKTVLVHDGKEYVKLNIKKYMIGRKAGSFVITKRLGAKIHMEKKKKRRK